MKILIINGANLNLLGRRENEIYGEQSWEDYFDWLGRRYCDDELDLFQSNIEGELVDAIQQAEGFYDALILNAGGYTHTSVVLRDAIAAAGMPVVEVHISNIAAREEFRHTSLLTPVCCGLVMGFGLDSYRLAIEALR